MGSKLHGWIRGALAWGMAREHIEFNVADGIGAALPAAGKGKKHHPALPMPRWALVDNVFPRVPVRQWVLSLPHRLRYRLAWDHTLCRAVVGCAMRAILGPLGQTAGAERAAEGHEGGLALRGTLEKLVRDLRSKKRWRLTRTPQDRAVLPPTGRQRTMNGFVANGFVAGGWRRRRPRSMGHLAAAIEST